jgi:excisionase family DNA binding protein
LESDGVDTLEPRGRWNPLAGEVLTIKEVAALLKLAEKTAYAMAQAGEIPAFRIRGQWRIKRTELNQ